MPPLLTVVTGGLQSSTRRARRKKDQTATEPVGLDTTDPSTRTLSEASRRPETTGQAKKWDANFRMYVASGFCSECASQASWGHQLGFRNVRRIGACCAGKFSPDWPESPKRDLWVGSAVPRDDVEGSPGSGGMDSPGSDGGIQNPRTPTSTVPPGWDSAARERADRELNRIAAMPVIRTGTGRRLSLSEVIDDMSSGWIVPGSAARSNGYPWSAATTTGSGTT